MTSQPPIGIVAGSGIVLDALLDDVSAQRPFHQFPGLNAATVSGHAGLFIQGQCQNHPIIIQSGRLHFYEGHDHKTVTRPVDVLHKLGVRTILFTNAAGALRPEIEPGHLMAATSIHLWPCRRWPAHPDTLAIDLVLDRCGHSGPYAWVHGPCYETRAEIAALQAMGAHAVGMSTAPEIARCQDLGIRTAVISCITNNCCTPQVLTHDHVLRTARNISAKLCDRIRAALPQLAQNT